MGTPAGQRLSDQTALASVGPQTFRSLMGSLASGVSVVTTLDGMGPRGFTCSAVCSVSATPPLLLSGVNNRSGTLRVILDTGRFAVNFLSEQGAGVSSLFASDSSTKFDDIGWEPGKVTGMPLLEPTVAHAECVVAESVGIGDHTLLIGRIVGGGTEQERLPLSYWRGDYGRLLRHELSRTEES
ncbi:flavin reductase [Streptomyces armeniacus]|uniref:Flavin reductase n=1 Tax=Streptomyces armeniacus TaxID=83291 RepID=A0A345XJK8_9ACTN|nr:flavin reductase family protein [Streptomyces armeniacus]AXK31824.1 flavin reductase [Streptomyces armeniacus]